MYESVSLRCQNCLVARLRVPCCAADQPLLRGGLLQQDPSNHCQGAEVRTGLGIQVTKAFVKAILCNYNVEPVQKKFLVMAKCCYIT